MKKMFAGFVASLMSCAALAQTFPVQNLHVLGTSTLDAPLTIANGGTGAATQSAALTGLLGSSLIPIANGGTNASTATGATSQLQYLQGGTGSGARSLTSKFQERVSVLDFTGVDPTGATDSSNGVQAAINAVCNAGGGTLYFPAGTYKIGTQIANITCQGLYIAGAGIFNTTITSPNTTINLLPFNAVANQGIRDVTLTFSGTQTAGCALCVTGVQNFTADRLKITNAFQGVNISGGVIQYYTDLEIRNTVAATGVDIYVTGLGNDQFFKNIVTDHPSASQPLACMRINSTNALWLDAFDGIHCGTGLLLDPQAATDYISWLFVSNSAFDTSSGDGIKLAPANASAVIKGATFVNSWSSTNSLMGVDIAGVGVVDGVRFVGHRSFNNGQSGYFLNAANAANMKNVEFNDSDASGNSQSSSGTYSGFDIGGGISGFSITNSHSGQQAQFGNTQSRGIIVNPGSSNNYVLMGNDVRGNINNSIYDGGTGTNKIIKGNLGYNPIASTSITVGASPFTYTNNTGDAVNVFVTGGTVSSVTLGGNTVATATNTVVPVPQGSSVVVTYSAAPTMTYIGN